MAEVTVWHHQIKLLACWVFHESWLPAAQLFCRCGAGRSHPLVSYRAASSAFEMSSRLWVFFKDVSWSSGYTPKCKWIKSPCDDLLVTPAVYIPMLTGWSFTANGSDRNTSFICVWKKKASVMLWCLDKPHLPEHIVNRRPVPWSWVCHAWLIHQPWQSCSH